jgi:hypothetical protein
MMSVPSPGPRARRTYDHRLREHVVHAGVRSLGHRLTIPRSTVSTWQRRGIRPVVTIEPLEQDRQQLLDSIARLDRRARVLAAVVRLLLALLRVSGFNLCGRRLPEGAAKADTLVGYLLYPPPSAGITPPCGSRDEAPRARIWRRLGLWRVAWDFTHACVGRGDSLGP